MDLRLNFALHQVSLIYKNIFHFSPVGVITSTYFYRPSPFATLCVLCFSFISLRSSFGSDFFIVANFHLALPQYLFQFIESRAKRLIWNCFNMRTQTVLAKLKKKNLNNTVHARVSLSQHMRNECCKSLTQWNLLDFFRSKTF